MEDRILLSENCDLWGIFKPFTIEGFSGTRVIDHIENGYGQVINELPEEFVSSRIKDKESVWGRFRIEKDSIITFFVSVERCTEDKLPPNWFGIINSHNEVICSYIAEFGPFDGLFTFNDEFRQVILLDTIVGYDGTIRFKSQGCRIIGSNSGFHLFIDKNDKGENKWEILSPDYSIIDVEVPYSDQKVNKGFINGVLLLGSTLINQEGKVILDDVYDYKFDEDNHVFIVEDEETHYRFNGGDPRSKYRIILSKNGTLLFGVWKGLYDSYKLIHNYSLDKDLGVDRCGIANPDFSILLPMCFEFVHSNVLENPNWWIVRIDGQYGILSKDCKSWIAKPRFNAIEYDKIGVFKYSDSSLGSGLMALDGEVFFEIKDTFDYSDMDKLYLRASDNYPGYIFVTTIDKDWDIKSGVISRDKGEIIPLRRGWINMQSMPLRYNRFLFRENGELYENGEDSDYIDSDRYERVFSYKGGVVGLLDETGKVILEPRYSDIRECYEDNYPPCYLTKLGDEWILFDFNGESLVKHPCTYISWYQGGYARFIVGGSIDSEEVYEGSALYRQTSVLNGRFGLYNHATRRSTDPIFDYIGDMEFVDGKFSAQACLNGKWGTINGRLEFTPSGGREKEIPVSVLVSKKWIGEVDIDQGYTSEDLNDMYWNAYEGDPEALWNTD